METIYFYTKDEPFGEFSNFSAFGIEINGFWWPTVEHYFQAQKFLEKDYQEKIRKSFSAKEAANLGRSRAVSIRLDWEDVKIDLMFNAVLKKFQTHSVLRELLIATEDKVIIENSPNDYYWGGGQDGTGQNHLGKILMQVRSILQSA